ncbi:unnamed protein product [Paramecium sonneborni]|uniref:TLDc domain-containing protein n=1 Tax=Paramecium sonneborni TaxID=65129 RepID=A0A8S1RUG1_9CILI|nr:unnamed protein product [Paramecium sonneborni]
MISQVLHFIYSSKKMIQQNKQQFIIKINLYKSNQNRVQNQSYQKTIFGFDYSLLYKKNQKKQQKNHNQFIKEAEMDSMLIHFGINVMERSEYIFGGYSPCQQQKNQGYVQDDTLSSFLFSQTHSQIYPLKQDRKQCAICCQSFCGPTFGGGHDLLINSDFKSNCSNLGNSYECNQQGDKATYLSGQDKSIKECEIFELKFL